MQINDAIPSYTLSKTTTDIFAQGSPKKYRMYGKNRALNMILLKSIFPKKD